MKHFVRAGGFAAAALALAASALFADPSRAWQGDFAPIAPRFLSHADIQADHGGLGLNSLEPGTASADAAMIDEHALAMVATLASTLDAAVPRPRALDEKVAAYGRVATQDAEQECLAAAVYFEARGESLAGQLAVADVVLNRVASPRYPGTICEVVVQPWQFSFIERGKFPRANKASAAWKKSVGIARVAQAELDRRVPQDVLWYHADYVSPGWGKRLDRVTKIGLHIFYQDFPRGSRA